VQKVLKGTRHNFRLNFINIQLTSLPVYVKCSPIVVQKVTWSWRLLAGRLLAGRLLAGRLLAGRLLAGRLLAGRLLVGRLLAWKAQ
jgi:hypothetical protein